MTCDTLGLYARSVEDLQLLAEVFRLADDAAVPSTPFELAGAKVAFCRTPNWAEAGPGTKAAWGTAKEALAKKGASVEEIELPEEFSRVLDWAGKVLAGEGRSSFLGREFAGFCFSSYFVRCCVVMRCETDHRDAEYLHDKANLSKYIQEIVENGSKTSRKDLLDAYDNVARLRPIWDDIASKYDAVLAPSVPDEAPIGISRTGSPVRYFLCVNCSPLIRPRILMRGCEGLLRELDSAPCPMSEHTRLCGRKRSSNWLDACCAAVYGCWCSEGWEGDWGGIRSGRWMATQAILKPL